MSPIIYLVAIIAMSRRLVEMLSGKGRPMIPATFSYHPPTSIADATALLTRYGDDATVLSGGQSVIHLMKPRLATPQHVNDINRIETSPTSGRPGAPSPS